MRLLILGGTVFLGRALTDAALAAGHDVTHLNRGRSGTDPRVETIAFDRESIPFTVSPAGRTWDAAIDTCGYLPQVVRRSAVALRDRVGCYAFISSISAYRSFEREDFDEDSALFETPDPLPTDRTPELYGALKAGCERVVSEVYGERAFLARPGLIVGPHDPTDRFTWWPWRAAQGGRFAAPGRRERRVQFIDARDIADWMVAMLARSASGTFHVTGPQAPLTMGELVDACVHAAGDVPAQAVWMPDEFLRQQEIAPWSAMPLWLPEGDPAWQAFMAANVSKAVAQGLVFRPLEATVRDVLAWARARATTHEWKAGLPPARETALLQAWDDAK